MTYTIDKDIPIPRKVSDGNRFRKLLANMDEGDSVLFPWHRKEDGKIFRTSRNQRVSAPANHFMRFLKDSGCKYTSRSIEDGRRVWLLEKNV